MIINDKILGLCKELATETNTIKNNYHALYHALYKVGYYDDGVDITFFCSNFRGKIFGHYDNCNAEFDAGDIVSASSRTMAILSKLLFALEKQLKKEKEKEEIL